MKIQKSFYSLLDLPQRWSLSLEDILHLAANSELTLSLNYRSRSVWIKHGDFETSKIECHWLNLDPEIAIKFLTDDIGLITSPHKYHHLLVKAPLNFGYLSDGQKVWTQETKDRSWGGPMVELKKIIVHAEEVSHFEKQNDRTSNAPSKKVHAKKPPPPKALDQLLERMMNSFPEDQAKDIWNRLVKEKEEHDIDCCIQEIGPLLEEGTDRKEAKLCWLNPQTNKEYDSLNFESFRKRVSKVKRS